MKLSNNGEINEVPENQAGKYLRRGWTEIKEQAGEEIIRLKPPVKNKATAQRALEEAKDETFKGDE